MLRNSWTVSAHGYKACVPCSTIPRKLARAGVHIPRHTQAHTLTLHSDDSKSTWAPMEGGCLHHGEGRTAGPHPAQQAAPRPKFTSWGRWNPRDEPLSAKARRSRAVSAEMATPRLATEHFSTAQRMACWARSARRAAQRSAARARGARHAARAAQRSGQARAQRSAHAARRGAARRARAARAARVRSARACSAAQRSAGSGGAARSAGAAQARRMRRGAGVARSAAQRSAARSAAWRSARHAAQRSAAQRGAAQRMRRRACVQAWGWWSQAANY